MFVPAIAAMGGNSGMQTSTVVVRGLATGDLAALRISQVFSREIRVGIVVAVVCAMLAGTIAFVWLGRFPVDNFDVRLSPIIGLSVGLAMFCAITLSTLMGLSLPYIFRRLGIDPAISCGPLVTTSNDVIGYLTYFSLSLLLIKYLSSWV